MTQAAARTDKILVVDDDARIRDLLRRYLTQQVLFLSVALATTFFSIRVAALHGSVPGSLAVLIAVMGISNTISLAVPERTRELGLLRAVGQTRRQTRTMVRWESVMIAVFGTLGGVVLGTFLGWGMVQAIGEQEGIGEFALPVSSLVIVMLLGAAAGTIAALRPARRAARLDVLEAIATS